MLGYVVDAVRGIPGRPCCYPSPLASPQKEIDQRRVNLRKLASGLGELVDLLAGWFKRPLGASYLVNSHCLSAPTIHACKSKEYPAHEKFYGGGLLWPPGGFLEVPMLATQINDELGSRQGSKHALPDLWRDISELMKAFQEHNAEVMNILAEGVEMLKKPLNEYNEAFKTLQARRRRQPLIRRYHRKQSGPTQSSSVSPQQDSNETQTEIARAADDDSEDVVWDDT
ncbi:hypothetical protein K474DRAFT_1677020 [Panus rudis PR-1116 ss-1]|nr:hypothetical protein K474DRAFT_1677020 [Panus rudis PR-1116 ss-1]